MATTRKRGDGSKRDRRGFASMDPVKQRQIAKKGGEASSRMQRRDSQGQFAGSGGSSRGSGSSAISNAASGSGSGSSTSRPNGRGRSSGGTKR